MTNVYLQKKMGAVTYCTKYRQKTAMALDYPEAVFL